MDDRKKYVTKCTSEKTKNHQGETSETEGTGGKMFATGTPFCPAKLYENYLSKRPQGIKRLFLHTRDRFNDGDYVWYRKEPIGKDYLAGMMMKFSKTAKLSQMYTNHCIRATCITILNHCGFESRHITTVSGHKNQQSLASYCYDTSDRQKEVMSNASARIENQPQALPAVPSRTILPPASSRQIQECQNENCPPVMQVPDFFEEIQGNDKPVDLDFLEADDQMLVS